MKLHIFTADHQQGYKYHHTVGVVFDSPQDVLMACSDVIKNMHKLFNIEIELITLENKVVEIMGEEVEGIMLASANLPYSCFADGPLLETDKTFMHAPGCPDLAKLPYEVPEC